MREEVIGDCRLILGDCRDILPTLGRVDTIVTDPPYGMAFRSNHRATRHEAIANDGDAKLLQWACGIDAAHSKYVFCRWDNLSAIPKPRSVITWIKNNWSMGDLAHEHARQTEAICFWPGAEHAFPSGRPSDVVHAARTGNEHHPTEKPVALMEHVLSWTAGVVLDPFMGSSSTGVACIRAGRKFIGIEIDPAHYETALRRIEAEHRRPRLALPEPVPRATQEALL